MVAATLWVRNVIFAYGFFAAWGFWHLSPLLIFYQVWLGLAFFAIRPITATLATHSYLCECVE